MTPETITLPDRTVHAIQQTTISIPTPRISTGPKGMTEPEAARHYLSEMRQRTDKLQAGSGVTELVNRLLDDVIDALATLDCEVDR